MRAAIVEAPGQLRVHRDVPKPRPGRFQALVRVECCATCNGTDDKLIHGGMALEYPAILGHESVGVVTELGPDVTGFAPGERVLRPTAVYPGDRLGPYRSGWGGYAEWGLVTDLAAAAAAGESAPLGHRYARYQQKVPTGIAAPDAAMAITLKETLSWSRRLGVGDGSAVLIIGDGPVGLAFTAWVARLGASAHVAGRRPERLAAAQALGAAHLFPVDRDRRTSDALAAAGSNGYDFIIDTVGLCAEFPAFERLLQPGGRLGLYGVPHGGVPKAAQGYTVPFDEAETHDEVFAAIGRNEIDPSRFYDAVVELDAIRDAFAAIAARRTLSKVVVRTSH